MRIRPWLPSIDRIDSARGYVPGNVRVVCAFVNIAMKAFGEGLFTEVLRGIVETAVKARMKLEGMRGEDSIPTVGLNGNAAGTEAVDASRPSSVSD